MIEEKKYQFGHKNINICLLADLHFDEDYNLDIFNKIIASIDNNKPDFICFAGDIIESSKVVYSNQIDNLKKFIKELSLIAPVIISLGNHDIVTKKENQFIENFNDINNWFLDLNKFENVYYLNNKSLVRGDICFTSFNPPFKYYKKEKSSYFIEEIDKSISMTKKYYNILLCHSPINVLKKETISLSKQIKKADLILSGHMHNGLVPKIFDFGGNIGIISPMKTLFPPCARNSITKKIDNHEINLVISGAVVKFSSKLKKLNSLYPISISYIKI